MSTPILPLAVWQSGSTQPSLPVNDNALRGEILAGLVLSKTTTAQPASPADGAIYIIPTGATGAQWATFAANDVAIYRAGTWYAYAPVEGLLLKMADGPQQYTGGAWVASALWAPATATLVDAAAAPDLPAAGVATAVAELLQTVRNGLKWLTSRFNGSGALAIAYGGTGATTAPDARTALGVPSTAEAVLVTGAQTVAGVKTWTGQQNISGNTRTVYGPNSAGGYIAIGGAASTVPSGVYGGFFSTGSNVHLDSGGSGAGLFLNFYNGNAGVNFGNGAQAIVATMSAAGALSTNSSITAGGPLRLGQYTLTTLPSASAYSGYYIDVTNATGGPKLCRSNGTVWQIANTTTTVS